jgi:selenocysteine lyase/cysteine desulfurase
VTELSGWQHLFTHALEGRPERLHMAAHSHHPWPDATRDAQLRAWDDAAERLDRKWDRVMGEVWPRAQAGVAAELNLPDPSTVVFAPNTHQLLLTLASGLERRPLRVLSTDGEFHSFRRQAARWAEAGRIVLETVATEPWDSFPERFRTAAERGGHDLIFVSHVFFGTGRVYDDVQALAALARPEGPWVAIDGYHGFMALPTDLAAVADRVFYMSGGYKYAMAGEGAAFLHAPPGFGPRPEVTGWYAEFGELSGPPGGVGYARDASRFLGATFDPSGLYRVGAVFDLLAEEGLTTARISAHVDALKTRLLDQIATGNAGPLSGAELLNPPRHERPNARYIALRHPNAAAWQGALAQAGVITDVRADVLRIGLGLYHDEADLHRFADACRALPA